MSQPPAGSGGAQDDPVWTWLGFTGIMASIFGLIYLSSKRRELTAAVRSCIGISRERAKNLIKELTRKAFHFSGMVMPAVYFFGLRSQLMDKRLGIYVMVTVTSLYLLGDVLRLSIPAFNHYMLVTLGWNRIMRKEEYNSFTGIGYYFAGNTLATLLFTPSVTIVAMLALILGDFAAALVGKAIGRRKLVGSKSLEGTLACFAVCLACGLFVFASLLPDLTIGSVFAFAFVGAAAAALAELFAIVINDNILIPLACGLAISTLARAMGMSAALTSHYEAREALPWTWFRSMAR
eukprot:c22502_g1_i1.p1 GENE.c22502_g1_i1~~c22502_g1_i1.p1  ORF type:complete len:311 (+),score=54.55 c22502_g1_i1:55-933(+)